MHHSSLLKLFSAVSPSTSLRVLLHLVHGGFLKLKGLTTVKTFNLPGSHCVPHYCELFKYSKSAQDLTEDHQVAKSP